MGRAAVPLDTIWPNGSDPKTLVCVKAQCTVAELFNTVFGDSDLTEQLHKQRGDGDLVETPWYDSREALPSELYTWQVSDPPNKPSDTLRHRKVRFESPPTALASKPFQNEESQVITEMYPDTLYVVEAVSSTSAPYGDKFNVFFRYIFRADGPSASAMQLLFHVEWLPSMSRMMRPVVGKAVDAGVRGTFKIFRNVLGGLRPVVDIREADMPVGGPPAVVEHEPMVGGAEAGELAAAGAAAVLAGPHPHYIPSPTVGLAPGLGPPPDLLSALAQQLVYKDQVVMLADLLGAGLRSVSTSDLGARTLAAALTVWLISIVVAALRGWQALCRASPSAAEVAGGGGGGGGGLMWVVRLGVCWPLALVDLPDSTAEVLTSLALVAAINWAVMCGTEALVRHLSRANPALLAAARGGGGSGGAGAAAGAGGVGSGDVIGGVPFSQTPLLTSRASSGGGAGAAANASRAPSVSTPTLRSVSATAPSSVGMAAAKDKDQGKSGCGAGAFLAGKLGISVAAATSAAPSKPMRAAPAPKQFTQAQLRQLELGQLTSSRKPPAAPTPAQASAVPAAAAMADAWAADMPLGMVAPSNGTDMQRAPSPPPRAASPQLRTDGSDARTGAAAAAAEPASPKPADGGGAISAGPATATAPPAGGAPPPAGPPTTPAPSPASKGAAAVTATALPPAAAAPSASVTSSQQPVVGSMTASSTFANMFTREGIDSMAESLRSAFRWDTVKAPDTADTGSPDSFSSPPGASHHHQQLAKLKARSDAGGALSGEAAATITAAAAAPAAMPGRRPAQPGQRSAGGAQSFTVTPSALSAPAPGGAIFSVHSEVPLLTHDEEMYGMSGGVDDDGYDGDGLEPALVVEEVFENERFQPFRGWGHMWPGHFLPSDRVGHWSDRQGKPGGGASMVFEQVVPQLPPGWQWVEEDWQVDLEGVDVEAVDPDGWTYALDFYLLKYPPPPQGGKCSLKHFVRRRRYFRTRVRPEDRSTRSSGGFYGQEAESAPASDDYDGAAAVAGADEGSGPAGERAAAAAAASDPLAVGERLLSLSEGFSGTVTSPPAAHSALAATASAPPLPGGSADQVGLELRPPQPSAALAVPPGDDGRGIGLHGLRPDAEGLSGDLARQQQQQDIGEGGGSGRNARASLSGPAGGTMQAATQAMLGQLSSSSGGAAGGAAAGKEKLREGDRGGGGGGGSGDGLPLEMFVLSPKTEMRSHDPLGALIAEEVESPVAADPPPVPVSPSDTAAAATNAAVFTAGDSGGQDPSGFATAAAAIRGPSPVQGVVAREQHPAVPAVIASSTTADSAAVATTTAPATAAAPPPGALLKAPELALPLPQQEKTGSVAAGTAVATAAQADGEDGGGGDSAGDSECGNKGGDGRGNGGGDDSGGGGAETIETSRQEAKSRASRGTVPQARNAAVAAGGASLPAAAGGLVNAGELDAAAAGVGVAEGPIIAAEHVE